MCQATPGRFHHFQLARQLERTGLLAAIHTGYPRFKLRDESGIPREKIHSFPWFQTPYLALSPRLPYRWGRNLGWLALEMLDRHVAGHLGTADVLVALSSTGLRSGRAMQSRGGLHICDRGSSHIRFQDEILREEYRRWKFPFPGIEDRLIRKEESEYAQADHLTVPSGFVHRSFVEKGVPAEKISTIAYGGRLDRFQPTAPPDDSRFTVLFVGQVSLRKGFLYLLEAFRNLRHPRKELLVAGPLSSEVRQILQRGAAIDGVHFLGRVQNAALPELYRRAQVCVLPSVEDGFGMVAAEAMASGRPVITTVNAGAADLVTGAGGFVVPIRDPDAILEKLESLLQDPVLRLKLSESAAMQIQSLGGWNEYGDRMTRLICQLSQR